MLRSLIRNVACAGMVAFHAILLWQRCVDATILEPLVLARYVGTLFLFAAVFAFRRLAPPSLRGRRALLVFWLVVLLLHAGAPFSVDTRDLDSEIVTIVQLGLVVPLVIAAAYVAAAASLAASRAQHRVAPLPIVAAFARERIPLPARAPPRGR